LNAVGKRRRLSECEGTKEYSGDIVFEDVDELFVGKKEMEMARFEFGKFLQYGGVEGEDAVWRDCGVGFR
jgi:hypothetical protein